MIRNHAGFAEFMELSKEEIIKDYLNGESLRQIASDYEISASTVERSLHAWGILSGRRGGRRGNLYIIIAIGTPYCKVGFTSDEAVRRRLSSLQSGCPYKLKVARVFENQTELAERGFHEKLIQYRVRGEWFKRFALLDRLIAGALSLDDFLEMAPTVTQGDRRQLPLL